MSDYHLSHTHETVKSTRSGFGHGFGGCLGILAALFCAFVVLPAGCSMLMIGAGAKSMHDASEARKDRIMRRHQLLVAEQKAAKRNKRQPAKPEPTFGERLDRAFAKAITPPPRPEPPKAEPTPSILDLRDWTDRNGNVVKAAYVEYDRLHDRVVLKREDGKEGKINFDDLSTKCQNFVRSKRRIEQQLARVERERADRERKAAELKSELTSRLSMSTFLQVKNGMTFAEVKEILGGGFELLADTEIAGHRGAVVMWKKPGRFQLGNAHIHFQDGRVCAKAQFGL